MPPLVILQQQHMVLSILVHLSHSFDFPMPHHRPTLTLPLCILHVSCDWHAFGYKHPLLCFANENSFLQHLQLSHFFALTVAFLGPIAPSCWLPSANLVCGMSCLTHQTDAVDVGHIANSMVSIPYSFLQSFGQPIEHIPSIMATGPCLLVQLSKLLPGTSSAFI